jgi:isoleucyl-tRNA synthetase
MFDEITVDTSFTRIEEDVRRFWRLHGVTEACSAPHPDAPPYQVVQQPLAAAGQPWADQVRLLAAGDLMARYLAMQSFAVQRKLGWECHGLRIEAAVEQSLGPGVADYDLAQFNTVCREAALEGMHQGEALADRLGVWYDSGDTYATLSPQSIGIVWRALRQLWEARRLKYERRLVSVCPRCATPLSAAEAARRAVKAEARTARVRLPWDGESDAYFLIWTPAAWTLAGMVALAVHPKTSYALVEITGRRGRTLIRLLLAEEALDRTLTGEYRLVRRLNGKQLRRAHYRPLFTFLPTDEGTGRIILSEHVPLDHGTGLLPVTPSFDTHSLALAHAHGLPVPDLLDDWGALNDAVTPWRGLSPFDAEPLLVDDLRVRGLLFEEKVEARSRSVCPYCNALLLPQIRDVWLVDTDSDPWIVGRDRTWGTPLPVWQCDVCDARVCVGGLDDLGFRTGQEIDQGDLHRPDVDRLTFPCSSCGGTMHRVQAVVDAAFEAAVVPWMMTAHDEASVPADRALVGGQEESTPRSVAVGLGDRELGWTGDVIEIIALLRGALAWEQAVALPEDVVGSAWDSNLTPPADVLRWAAYAGKLPDQAERDFLRPLWHLATKLLEPGARPHRAQQREEQAVLNRWLLARLHQTIATVTTSLDACDPGRAAKALSTMMHDLARWYTPPWPEGEEQLLETLSRLLAPFVPHLADAIHRQIGGRTETSVHQLDWPEPNPAPADRALLAGMALVWRLVALGKIARGQAGLDPDRRLRRAVVVLLSEATSEVAELIPYRSLLAQLLKVDRVQFAREMIAARVWHLSLAPDLVVERGVTADEIDTALEALPPRVAARLVFHLWDGRSISLQAADQVVTLLPDEVHVSAMPGWAASAEGGRLLILKVG